MGAESECACDRLGELRHLGILAYPSAATESHDSGPGLTVTWVSASQLTAGSDTHACSHMHCCVRCHLTLKMFFIHPFAFFLPFPPPSFLFSTFCFKFNSISDKLKCFLSQDEGHFSPFKWVWNICIVYNACPLHRCRLSWLEPSAHFLCDMGLPFWMRNGDIG